MCPDGSPPDFSKLRLSLLAQGKKLDDLASVEVPDSVKKWVGPSMKAQIKDTYEEITQGKPHGEIKSGK